MGRLGGDPDEEGLDLANHECQRDRGEATVAVSLSVISPSSAPMAKV